jgi:hypothetical protein
MSANEGRKAPVFRARGLIVPVARTGESKSGRREAPLEHKHVARLTSPEHGKRQTASANEPSIPQVSDRLRRQSA